MVFLRDIIKYVSERLRAWHHSNHLSLMKDPDSNLNPAPKKVNNRNNLAVK
jgi:hypothetical protein